jgi:hypothetical protein
MDLVMMTASARSVSILLDTRNGAVIIQKNIRIGWKGKNCATTNAIVLRALANSERKRGHKMKEEQIEQFLKNAKVRWEYHESFSLDKIKKRHEASENIRGTGEKFDQTHLDIMQDHYDKGFKFPAIIVTKNGRSYIPIDGIHRIELFARNAIKTHPAYEVIDPSEKQIINMQGTANFGLNGRDVFGKRLELAVIQVVHNGMTSKGAAAFYKVSESAITANIRACNVRAALIVVGFDFKRKPLLETILASLAAIVDRTPALVGAANLISDAKMGISEARALILKLKKAPDDAAISEILAKERRLSKGRTTAACPARISQLRSAMTKFVNLRRDLKSMERSLKDIKRSTREELHADMMQCIEVINEIAAVVIPSKT